MEAKFEQEDFKDLKYPVLSLGTRNILDTIQHLKVYPEFNEDLRPLDKETVLRYVFLKYQPSILDTLDTLEERKYQAALLAGFKLRKGKFLPEVEQILSCESEKVNRIIIRVCKLSRNTAFQKLMVLEQAYEDVGKMLIGEKSRSDKYKDLLATFNTLEKEIIDCREDTLNKDTTQTLIERLYDHVDASQLGITPETISDAKIKGVLERIIPNPYA